MDLDLDTFEAVARFLGQFHDASKWWIADLLREAEARFGESAYQVAAGDGPQRAHPLNWIWVASRVPRSRRREELSFRHHVLVAPLELPEQRRWLQRAVDERLSSRELRDAMAAERALGDGDSTRRRDGLPRTPRPGGRVVAGAAHRVWLPRRLGADDRGRGLAGNHRGHKDGRVSATLSPADLARRVRLQGLRIDRGTAEMFLAWWLLTGVVEEVLPGQFRLTDQGHRVAGGLLAAGDGEVA